MANKVIFKQGKGLTSSTTLDQSTVYASTDKALLGIGGQLYYGQPTIEYKDNKIVLWGINGTEKSDKLGEVDLTLDSMLEDAKYFETLDAAKAGLVDETKGITASMVEEAYNSAFGAGYSGSSAAIYMVMHTEASSGDTHSVVCLPVGKLIGDAQTEVDAIETAVGLTSGGTYIPTTGSVTSASTSVMGAIDALDTQVKANTDAIATLNGTDEVPGSVANSIKTAIDGLNASKTGTTEDEFITVTVGEGAGLISSVTVTDVTKEVSAATATDDGLAKASDVKAYVDAQSAKATTVVEHNADNKNITVTSVTDSETSAVKYTVNETGLTVAVAGSFVAIDNTVAANLSALDSALSDVKEASLTGGSVNDVDVTVTSDEDGSSFAVVISGSDINVGDYTAVTYPEAFKGAVPVEGADTIAEAFNSVETTISALTQEVLDNEEVNAQAIKAIADSAGLISDETITYNQHTTDSILSGATTLDAADVALANAIRAIEGEVGGIQGKDAIVVSATTSDDAHTEISLKIDTANGADATTTGVKVTQGKDGLKTELKLENAVASATTGDGGIGLAVNTTGNVEATLYWGTF